MPGPQARRRSATPLIVAAFGCAAVVVGLIVLLSDVHTPISPIDGEDVGSISQISCGNSLSAPPLTGIFTDIDVGTGGPGFFQQMADNACSQAKTPRRLGGGALAVVGLLVLAGALMTWLAAARRAREDREFDLGTPAPEPTEN